MRLRPTVVTALCLVLAGCTGTVAGTATTQAGGTSTTTTTAAAATPKLLAPTAVGNLLLDGGELAQIVGETDMQFGPTYAQRQESEGITPVECASRVTLADSNAYSAPARQTMTGNDSVGPKGVFVTQIAAVYDTSKDKLTLTAFDLDWRAGCKDGREIAVTGNGPDSTWIAGRVDPPQDTWTNPNDIERMTTTNRQLTPTALTCGVVAARRENVLVETQVCEPGDAGVAQAGTVADRILAKVP